MKITKRQLRRIIMEERAKLLEMDRDTMMAQDAEYLSKQGVKSADSEKAQVPLDIFDDIVELLEILADDQDAYLAKKGKDLLLALERRMGAL